MSDEDNFFRGTGPVPGPDGAHSSITGTDIRIIAGSGNGAVINMDRYHVLLTPNGGGSS
jgi:hypothetical protein